MYFAVNFNEKEKIVNINTKMRKKLKKILTNKKHGDIINKNKLKEILK